YEAFYSDDDHIEEKSSGSTTTHADFSQYDSFIFDLSINPFPPADRSNFHHEEFADELAHIISPSEYDHFCFKIEPELGNLTMDVVNDIFPTREPRVHVPNVLFVQASDHRAPEVASRETLAITATTPFCLATRCHQGRVGCSGRGVHSTVGRGDLARYSAAIMRTLVFEGGGVSSLDCANGHRDAVAGDMKEERWVGDRLGGEGSK
ncbi:hypothetical protein Tco_0459684, partial [Tanacetum coccineum]